MLFNFVYQHYYNLYKNVLYMYNILMRYKIYVRGEGVSNIVMITNSNPLGGLEFLL